MSSNKSSVQSSSSNLSIVSSEKYWDTKDENNKEINDQYIKFPLKTWNEIVYKYKNQAKKSKNNERNKYKDIVNLILKKDVFKGEIFLEENNNYNIISQDKNIYEFLTNEFPKIVSANLKENKDSFIYPDFLVFDIKKDKFLEIIKKRNYMMNFNWNIPEEVKTINILGEIKISKKAKDHPKAINQQKKYELFIENYKEKYFVLMYVYDTSYVSFFSNKTKNSESTVPQIISYIPKTYLDDCYTQYNIINGLLYGETIEWKIKDEDIKEKINELNKKLDEKKDKLKDVKEKKEYLKKEKDILILLKENIVKFLKN